MPALSNSKPTLPFTFKGWQAICDVSRRGKHFRNFPLLIIPKHSHLFILFFSEFQKTYDRLDIRITERGESF